MNTPSEIFEWFRSKNLEVLVEKITDSVTEEDLYWFNVNDVFHWGCADAEPILNLDLLNNCYQELVDLGLSHEEAGAELSVLYAAMQRNFRPQNAYLNASSRELRLFYVSKTPPRSTDYGNPEELDLG